VPLCELFSAHRVPRTVIASAYPPLVSPGGGKECGGGTRITEWMFSLCFHRCPAKGRNEELAHHCPSTAVGRDSSGGTATVGEADMEPHTGRGVCLLSPVVLTRRWEGLQVCSATHHCTSRFLSYRQLQRSPSTHCTVSPPLHCACPVAPLHRFPSCPSGSSDPQDWAVGRRHADQLMHKL
jgi:hypothetical protein